MRRLDRVRPLLTPLLVASAGLCAVARADAPPTTRLKAVEKSIGEAQQRQSAAAQRADALAAELQRLRTESVLAARAAQTHEATLDRIDAQLAALAADERAKTATLARNRRRETALLMALARLAAAPPESFALAPVNPVDALRGALVLGRTVPPLVAEAKELKASLAALAAVRAAIQAARAHERSEKTALAAEEAQIAKLIARKSALEQSAAATAKSEGQRALALAGEAANLRDLVARLEAAREKAEAQRRKADAARQAEAAREAEAARKADAADKAKTPGEGRPEATVAVMAPPPVHPDPDMPRHFRRFSAARGAMVYPVTGDLVRRFGAPDDYGQASHGIILETRPGAIVVAPYDGQVMFAGPFHGYGHILIIAHGDGYHSLLAGLDRLDSRVGQWLVAGEPVGAMPDGATNPRLYLELRHNNQPINPAPWLSTRLEKVNG